MSPAQEERRPLPLADVRVVAVEQYGAGPFGSLHLAELGADVIKIEDTRTNGDIGRYIPPYQKEEDSLFFEALNRNKRSLALDLRTAGGRRVLHDLVRVSDAVYSNLRGDGPERLGLRYADLRHVNPRIVCCSLSGFGSDGPRRRQPAYDYMIQALAGWMSLTGEPDGPPAKTGPSVVDFSGGYVAAMSLLVGVHAARRDGEGMDCDVSLFDVAMSMLSYLLTWHLTEGYEPSRVPSSAHPSLVPFQNFETSDGWIAVCCPKPHFWERLCTALGRPDLVGDRHFADFEARREHRNELVEVLSAELSARPTAAWVRVLEEAGVPAAPVNTVPHAVRDPQVAARELIFELDHPRFGRVSHVRSGVRAGSPNRNQRRAPRRHEHANAILTNLLGYSADQCTALAREGAFGPAREA